RPFLQRLVRHAEVDIVAYERGSVDTQIADGIRSCRTVPIRPIRNTSTFYRLRTFFSPEDVQQRDAEMSASLASILTEREYDIVWVSGWRMLLYLPEVREHAAAHTRIIADVIDDEVRGNWQDFRDAKGLSANATMGRRLLRNSLYQRRFLKHADLALFVAEADAATTKERMPKLRVAVNQNGVDTDYFAPLGTEAQWERDDPVLLFEGTMSYAPNIEGSRYLVQKVLPLVQREIPNARVLLIGRDPTPELEALAGPDVELTGTVEDVRVHLRRGALLACSLRSGTGLKNKILQSWAMGIPVVATPISVLGLGATQDQELLIAEGAEAFAAECVRVLRSKDLRQRLGTSGRKLAMERYSLRVKLDEIDRYIAELRAGASDGPALLTHAENSCAAASADEAGHPEAGPKEPVRDVH
ncbi:MAG: glycosyltransferase family 4 protein, partial [Planctomycetota bacterium]